MLYIKKVLWKVLEIENFQKLLEFYKVDILSIISLWHLVKGILDFKIQATSAFEFLRYLKSTIKCMYHW